jgi:hypothetical protein
MAFTQTDLDSLDAAISYGELAVEVNGRKVVYRSVDDLIKARALVMSDISAASAAAASGGGSRVGSFRVTFATHRGD